MERSSIALMQRGTVLHRINLALRSPQIALMQHGMVDLCITGSDRTTINGDVCNKIGTYLKALAADDCNVPFYVALPASTIDWEIENGLENIPIEKIFSYKLEQIYWVK